MLSELTIEGAGKGIREKKFSISELVSDVLKSIKEKDTDIHAYLGVYADAESEARKKDEILRDAPESSPLFGIPIALKDNLLVKGRRTTAGSKILENYTGSYDATVVRKLKEAGAIIIGKTNLDEFAMGSSTENSAFGPTKNPHDLSCVPGGSSGGSAAAVAGNMAIAALGSDTGGSIRQPAALCGIVGFKPTYGRVSRHGLIAMASSLDQIGPLTKTVRDAELIFETISGGDNFDSTAIKDSYKQKSTTHSLKGLRIGLPKEYFGKGLDSAIDSKIRNVIKKIEQEGAEIKEISLPHSKYALPTYYIVVPSEVSANLARFDGIRYGHQVRDKNSTLFDVYADTRRSGFGQEVKRRIILGTYALSAGYYDAYYLKAQKVRRRIADDFKNVFSPGDEKQQVDIILGPTTPNPAFRLGEKQADPLAMYLEDIYTVALNLAGLPGISIPGGFVESKTGSKLPFGIQLVAPWFEEQKLFSVARAVEIII